MFSAAASFPTHPRTQADGMLASETAASSRRRASPRPHRKKAKDPAPLPSSTPPLPPHSNASPGSGERRVLRRADAAPSTVSQSSLDSGLLTPPRRLNSSNPERQVKEFGKMVPDQDNRRSKDKSRSYNGKGEEETSQARKSHHKHIYSNDKVEKERTCDKQRSCYKSEKERNHGKHKRRRAHDSDNTLNEFEYKKRKIDDHFHASKLQDRQGDDRSASATGHSSLKDTKNSQNRQGDDRSASATGHSSLKDTKNSQNRQGDDRSASATGHSSLKDTKNSQKRKMSSDAEDKCYRSEWISSKDDKQTQDHIRTGGPTNMKWQGPIKASEAVDSPVQSSEESVSMSDIKKSTDFEDRILHQRVRLIGKDLEAEEVQESFSNRRIRHSTRRRRLR